MKGYIKNSANAKKLLFLNLNKEEFVKKAVSITTLRPMNHAIIIKLNKGTIPINNEQSSELEMGSNRCSIST